MMSPSNGVMLTSSDLDIKHIEEVYVKSGDIPFFFGNFINLKNVKQKGHAGKIILTDLSHHGNVNT